MAQAFSPRTRYQNPFPTAGPAASSSEGVGRFGKQTSSPPPGPTGSAKIEPRTASYRVALTPAVHVSVCLSEEEVTPETRPGVPSGEFEQAEETQASAVHGSASSQSAAVLQLRR